MLFENVSLFESLDMSDRLLHDRPLNTPVVDHLFSDWEIELTTATHANETPGYWTGTGYCMEPGRVPNLEISLGCFIFRTAAVEFMLLLSAGLYCV